MHEGILLDHIKIFLYVCWDLGSFNVCEYVYREIKGVRFFKLYMEGNIYIDFYEQNSIPRGRLRMGRYVGFIVVMLSRRVIALLFPHPFLEARGGCFIYLFTCGYLEMENRGIIESMCLVVPVAWIQNLILFRVF